MREGPARSGRSRCASLPRASERPVRWRLSPAERRCWHPFWTLHLAVLVTEQAEVQESTCWVNSVPPLRA